MIENISNISSVLYSQTAVFGSWLKWLVGIVPIGIVIGIVIYCYPRLKSAFHDVEVIKDNNGYTCRYKNIEWSDFLLVRICLWIVGAWGLWKKIEPAKKHYNAVLKEVKKDLAQIVAANVWSKVSFIIKPWNGNNGVPANYYRYDHWDGEDRNYNLIDNIIANHPFQKIKNTESYLLFGDGGDGCIAGMDTESKRDELISLIQSVKNKDETKELVRKVADAKDSSEQVEKTFKKKLASIVRHVRFYA